MSLSGPNFVLNTIVAEALSEIAAELEKPGKADLATRIQALLQKYAKEHRRIVFNGDGYTEAWKKEAARRGLPNLADTVEALEEMIKSANIDLFVKHQVFNEEEYHARYEILLENYVKTLLIEGKTATHMAKRLILPAALGFAGEQARIFSSLQIVGVPNASAELLAELTELIDELGAGIKGLEKAIAKTNDADGALKKARLCRDQVRPAMVKLRKAADGLEAITAASSWPMPTYTEMLFHK